MNILYLSCHAILEYDELRLFEELGIDYFSLGSYINPQKPVDQIRPGLQRQPDHELISIAPDRDNMPKEFIDRFDVIIVMHKHEWIVNNWEKMKHKRVIWRTIGQSTPKIESIMTEYKKQGIKIMRYSPRERLIENYAGEDAIVRFYKDENEFKDWNGQDTRPMTIAQNMKHRGQHCNYDAFAAIAKETGAVLYGTTNQDSEFNGGFLTYEEMKQKLRNHRCFIYTGTQPASYTLGFIEAMMTGIPIVSIGKKLGNSLAEYGQLFEIPDILDHGMSGIISDDIDNLIEKTKLLQNNHSAAFRIGRIARKRAIAFFGMQRALNDWKRFLEL